MFAYKTVCNQSRDGILMEAAYAFDISMDNSNGMKIDQAARCLGELVEVHDQKPVTVEEQLERQTSFGLSAPLLIWT